MLTVDYSELLGSFRMVDGEVFWSAGTSVHVQWVTNMSSEQKKHEGVLTIDRAAFLLLRVKKAFKKKKQQKKEKK